MTARVAGMAIEGRSAGRGSVRTLYAVLSGALLLFAAVPATADHQAGAPTGVQVSAGDAKLTVTWTIATGEKDRHRVRWRVKQPPESWDTQRRGQNQSAYEITGLINGTTYEVQVATISHGGPHWSSTEEGTPVATYSIGDATAAEGTTAALPVTLSSNAPSPDGLAFSVTNDAAAADVGTVPTSFTVAAGSSSGTLSIPIVKDAVEENDETFTVTISTSVSGWSASDGTATVTITDTTEEISFSDTTVSVAEGSAAALVVARTGGTTDAAGFTVSTTAGSATATDFTALSSRSHTIAAGSSSTTISVATTQDALVENDETFTVALSATAADGWITGDAATVTIDDADDRTAAKIAFGSAATRTTAYTASIAEDGGSLSVPVTISHRPSASVTFDVEVGSGSATDGTDFSAPTSVTFGPSDAMTRNLTITISDDHVDEDDETIALSIAAADSTPNDLGDHYTRHSAGSTATLTITEDDTAGVTVTPTTLDINEGATGAYTVVLDSQPTHIVTVTPSSADSGAASLPSQPRVSFATAQWNVAQTVTVTAETDDDADDESVAVTHGSVSTDPKYGSSLSVDTVAVAVTDDDHATLSNLVLTGSDGNAVSVSPAFAMHTFTGYAATVENAITSVTVTPTATTASNTITVKVTFTPAGGSAAAPVTVASGTASGALALETSAPTASAHNVIRIEVTQDVPGGTDHTNTYELTVRRKRSADNTLSSGPTVTHSGGTVTLGACSAASVCHRQAKVAGSVFNVTVGATPNHARARATIDGKAASSPVTVALNPGLNVIPVVVTAENETTASYNVHLRKPLSLDVTPGDKKLDVDWENPGTDTGHLIRWRVLNLPTWQPSAAGTTPTGTAHTITGLVNGVTYVVQVKPVAPAGAIGGDWAAGEVHRRARRCWPSRPACRCGRATRR